MSDLLRFGLPPQSDVIAGSGGLGKSVSWARLVRARPTTLQSVDPGEVWILSAGVINAAGGDARALARLVRDVADAGVVAYLTQERLPDEALREADALQTPVVLLPPETSLADIEKDVVAFVVDRDRAIGQRVQQVYDQLLATLVEDRGTELLVGIVHDVTGKAVYLLDEHLQPTVQAGGGPAAAEALGQLRRRFLEGEAVASHARLAAIRPAGGDEPLGILTRPLTLRGAVAGYLALVAGRDDFGDFDYQVADRTTSVLAIELAKQSAVVEARTRVQGDFLEELLDTPAPALDQLQRRASALGYDLARPHVVFVLRPTVRSEGAAAARHHQRFVDVARRRLVLASVASLLRDYAGAVQVLAPCPRDVAPRDDDAVIAWIDGVRAELQDTLAPDPVSLAAGIGRAPDGERVTHQAALREAMQAAEIASSLPGGAATLHFARLGALRLIFHLAGNPELMAFKEDLLGPLEAYDRQHRSELVQTLEAFFRAGGNHVQAARNLHVHRNTLIYRLDRVRELLGGAELEDPDTRLNLQLALKIRASFGRAA